MLSAVALRAISRPTPATGTQWWSTPDQLEQAAGAALELQRIACNFAQLPNCSLHQFALISDLGIEILFTRTSPAGVAEFLAAG